MLTDTSKISALWKAAKGWGSTHPERETFEELFRSYNSLASSEVLTYANVLPRVSSDPYYNELKGLCSTNPVLEYEESSFKKVPLVKIHVDVELTPISDNCDHSFAILDKEGKQIRNIIPYDYSDEGIYNITLKTANDQVIPWGSCDWSVDVNASLLVFHKGVPQGISAKAPPKLTFYQYIGPAGERSYIDANLFDIESVEFVAGRPVVDITEKTAEFLNKVETNFFARYKYEGSDTSPGIGLKYNTLTVVTESLSGDTVKGYDDNSNSQVVSLLSHKFATFAGTGLDVLFVSEGVSEGTKLVSVTEDILEHGLAKVNVDDGFVIVRTSSVGSYKLEVTESEKLYAALLVKDNDTFDYEPFRPRSTLSLTIKVPVFIELAKLPPHLKLSSLSSYADHVTPQYYGPRTVDFVVAVESEESTTHSNRSADLIVYNRPDSNVKHIFETVDAENAQHVLFRNGKYIGEATETIVGAAKTITGESVQNTIISDAKLRITEPCFVENIDFRNCTVNVDSVVTFKNCKFSERTTVYADSTLALFENCEGFELHNTKTTRVIESRFQYTYNTGNSAELSMTSSSVVGSLNNSGNINCYTSNIDILLSASTEEGLINVAACSIGTLDCQNAKIGSTISATKVSKLLNISGNIVTTDLVCTEKPSEDVDERLYAHKNSISYYADFNKKVYATFANPFKYDEDTNTIRLNLGLDKSTLMVNEKGELQLIPLKASEILLEKSVEFRTQIQSVTGQSADTILEKERATVEDALVDLYWSKADLKHGKLPIEQLPDSVAYGGLEFVGMWQFEDHNGAYPTFEDIDSTFISDNEFNRLQKGWFFIVAASNHRDAAGEIDDPLRPQLATDGTEYIAGDWLILANSRDVLSIPKQDDLKITFTHGNQSYAIYAGDRKLDENNITTFYNVIFVRENAVASVAHIFAKAKSAQLVNGQIIFEDYEQLDSSCINVDTIYLERVRGLAAKNKAGLALNNIRIKSYSGAKVYENVLIPCTSDGKLELFEDDRCKFYAKSSYGDQYEYVTLSKKLYQPIFIGEAVERVCKLIEVNGSNNLFTRYDDPQLANKAYKETTLLVDFTEEAGIEDVKTTVYSTSAVSIKDFVDGLKTGTGKHNLFVKEGTRLVQKSFDLDLYTVNVDDIEDTAVQYITTTKDNEIVSFADFTVYKSNGVEYIVPNSFANDTSVITYFNRRSNVNHVSNESYFTLDRKTMSSFTWNQIKESVEKPLSLKAYHTGSLDDATLKLVPDVNTNSNNWLYVNVVLKSKSGNITAAEYVDLETKYVWEKLDKTYSDPVYSRLPEFATDSTGKNVGWSTDKNGVGLLELSYKSLAEAIRMINDSLLQLTPSAPASIQHIQAVIDTENSTAKKQEYISIGSYSFLQDLIEKGTVQEAWDSSKGGFVKLQQAGLYSDLPLESVFYCGTSSKIDIVDNDAIKQDYNGLAVNRFNPYEKWNLGIRTNAVKYLAADVTVPYRIEDLSEDNYYESHNVCFEQYELIKDSQILESVASYEGRSVPAILDIRKFYDLSQTTINPCSRLNLGDLKIIYNKNSFGGIGQLTNGTPIRCTFTIDNFTKFGAVGTDADVKLRAYFGEIECNITVNYYKLLAKSNEVGTYDLEAECIVYLPDVTSDTKDLTLEAKVINFGRETDWETVLNISQLLVYNPAELGNVVESKGSELWPKVSDLDKLHTPKSMDDMVANPELMFEKGGFGWPENTLYNDLKASAENQEILGTDQGTLSKPSEENFVKYNDSRYGFVTFKHSFENTLDINGFGIKLKWANSTEPEIDPVNGLLKDVILQVGTDTSSNLLNANANVSAFYTAEFNEAEACCYAGKSDATYRYVTFGKKPKAVKDVFVRVGIPSTSKLKIGNVEIVLN